MITNITVTTQAKYRTKIKRGTDMVDMAYAPSNTQISQEKDHGSINRLQEKFSAPLAATRVDLSLPYLPTLMAANLGDEADRKKEAEPRPEPERGPDWSIAFDQWGEAWGIHVYLFAVIFTLIAFYAAYQIGFSLHAGLKKKYLSFCLNIVMFLLGCTRAFVLFTDPYMQGTTINNVRVVRLIWALGSPCLTSADGLVILTLVETARISVAPPRMQKFRVIINIILFHFSYVIITEFIVAKFIAAKAMLVVCQVFFIVWGAVLAVGYFVLAFKLNRKLFGHKDVKSRKDKLYIHVIYVSGINNLIISALFSYSAFSEFGVYSDMKFVDAWSWWRLQTYLRVVEVVAAVLIFTVSAKRRLLKKINVLEGGEFVVNRIVRHLAEANNRRLTMFSYFQSRKVRTAKDKDTIEADRKRQNDLPPVEADIVIRSDSTVASLNQLVVERESVLSMLSDLHLSKVQQMHAKENLKGSKVVVAAVQDSEDKVDVPDPSHQQLLVEKDSVASMFSHLQLTKDKRELEESNQPK